MALQNILLAVEPTYESEEYLVARAKLLATSAMLRQYEIQFDDSETTPDPGGGESGVSS